MAFRGGGRQLPPEMEEAAEAKRKEFEAMIEAEGKAAGAGGAKKRVGPRFVLCHICGREFGQSSIDIHIKQCAQKWEEIEAQKPPRQRRPIPQKPEFPEGATLEEQNDAAKEAYEGQSMVHCSGCGRRFKDEETMRRHQGACMSSRGTAARGAFGGMAGRALPPEMQAAAEAKQKEFEDMIAKEGAGPGGGGSGKPTGPRVVVCHICGREFGRSSIDIHVKQCAKKWEEAEAQKPLRERKPLPTKPEVAEGATLEERNAAAKEMYEEQGTAHCPGCGRRFKDEETMQKHSRTCTALRGDGVAFGTSGGGRQLPPEMQAAAEAKQKDFEEMLAKEGAASGGGTSGKRVGPRVVMCYICGREFGKSSIEIHEKQCAKKWEEAEAQKPPRERRPLPSKPDVVDGASLEERNAAAKEVYEGQGTAHCPGCGRRFKDVETMQKHQGTCAALQRETPVGTFGRAGGRQLPPEMQAAAEAKQKEFEEMLAKEAASAAGNSGGSKRLGPRVVMCYICGREFGKSSIEIHERQCAKKWEEAEAQKPPRERRPLPTKPEVAEGATLEERNAALKKVYEDQGTAHCPGCGRRFKDEETMRKHSGTCAGLRGDGLAFGTSGGGRQLPPEMQAAAEAKQKEFEEMLAKEGATSGGGTSGKRVGPRVVMCYICGREFGKSSIDIHEKQCAKKWEEAEAQKPPCERKPLPTKPDVAEGATLEERNAAAKEVYEDQATARCPGCGRSFKDEETMRKHQGTCSSFGATHGPVAFGTSGGRQLPPEMQAAVEAKQKEFEEMLAKEGAGSGGGRGGGKPAGPRVVVCYICGREFGKSSIDIHEKQCAKKWEEAEAQKPPSERKPLPTKPEVAEGATLEERNAALKKVYEDQGTVHCPGCGRRFKDEETMRKHARTCTGLRGDGIAFGTSGGRQLPPEMQAAAEAKQKEFEEMLAKEGAASGGSSGGRQRTGPRVVVCYICGCEFGKSSIDIHEKQCAKKWEEREASKPPDQRRALPAKPDISSDASLEERNLAAKEVYQDQSMSQCSGCGRRFKDAETMRKHQVSCLRAAASSVPCPGCGRVFKDADAMTTHQQQCMSGGDVDPGTLDLDDALHALFEAIDVDNSGAIDREEFFVAQEFFARVGESLDFRIDRSFESMDIDHSGTVDEAEFRQALEPLQALYGPSKFRKVLTSASAAVAASRNLDRSPS